MIRAALLLLSVISSLLIISCSASEQLVGTYPDDDPGINIASTPTAQLGIYSAVLNPETNEGTIELNRSVSNHLNVERYLTGWPCTNCLKVKNLQFMPGNVVECDIEVKHPYPDPHYTVFNLRVIAIFPADEYIDGFGVSYALKNRDGMISLWDNPTIPGTINGFKAYNKEVERRMFAPNTTTSEHFVVQLPEGSFRFDIGVDASWYPNDGSNFDLDANSLMVIDLDGYVDQGLTDAGGLAELVVTMYDYQNTFIIGKIFAYSDVLFNAPRPLNLVSSDGHNIIYNDLISNEKHAPAGEYSVLIQVTDNEDDLYPIDISAYTVLKAQVYPSNISVTLPEIDNYKTPGNYYKFSAYGGPADHNLINYLDYNGPWDFTQIPFTDIAQRKILMPDDPEVATFIGSFPSADRVMKDDGNFGVTDGIYYQPEKMNYVQMKEVPLGFYEMEHFGGKVVFNINSDSGFPFPFDKNTSFTHTFNSTSLLSVTYNTQALGMGNCRIPLTGQEYKGALLIRHIIDIKIVVTVIKAIVYEWYDDDGNLLAMVNSANVQGQTPLWNESTYEIAHGGVLAMYEKHRQ